MGDTIGFTTTLTPCTASLNDTFIAQVPGIVRSLLDAGAVLSLNVSVTALAPSGNACSYRVTVAHPSGVWFCKDLLTMLNPANATATAAAIKQRLEVSSAAFASVEIVATSAAVITPVAPTPEESPIPFSPYVIIIPAVIVVVLFGVCLWMWCARPKIKRQERPVFDGFEMGDAQQLESSSNLEFAVPEVEFEDPRGGSKHRLTIN
jgi:hypothetical protein